AIAAYLAERPDCGRELAGFFQAKRDRLRSALTPSGFRLPPAQGTYFQLLDFSPLAASDDADFAERLLTQARVATIPLSPFYASPQALPFVRLCIAKRDATLDEAAARLNAFAARLRRACTARPRIMKKPTLVNHPPTVELPAGNRPLVAPIYQTVKFEFDTLEDTERYLRGERPG